MEALYELKPADSQFSKSLSWMGNISSQISRIYGQSDAKSMSQRELLGRRARIIALELASSERKSKRHAHEIAILSSLYDIMAKYPECFQKSEADAVKEMISRATQSFSLAKR